MIRRLVIAVVACAACGGSSSSGPVKAGRGVVVPSREATAGDRVLRHLPAGADLLIEVDLARVRGNPVVGDLVTRWLREQVGEPATAPDAAAADAATDATTDNGAATPVEAVVDLARAPLLTADAVVLAAYGVGTESAATATLLVGSSIAPADIPGAIRLDEHVALLAPPALARRAEAASAGAEKSLASDRELLALRTGAMPEKAESASVRLTGRLGFDARVALAAMTGADAVPRALSVWGDVVDDAALIAVLDGADDKQGDGGKRLEAALSALRDRLADIDALSAIGVASALRRTEIRRDGDRVRVVALIGPKRLRKAAARVATALPPPPAAPAPRKETSP